MKFAPALAPKDVFWLAVPGAQPVGVAVTHKVLSVKNRCIASPSRWPQLGSHATFSIMSGAWFGVTGTPLRKPPVPVLVTLRAKPLTVSGMPGARFVAGFSIERPN